MSSLTVSQTIRLRAAVNEWVSVHLPEDRTRILHTPPSYDESAEAWNVALFVAGTGLDEAVGHLLLDAKARIVAAHDDPPAISKRIATAIAAGESTASSRVTTLRGSSYEFRFGDGIEAARRLDNKSIDLLLTDPPYGISDRYTCEGQVPRRLRKNGSDFIMPKGHFGDWDRVEPDKWTAVVLPKVAGWAVIFCAQAQIGEYCEILKSHRFNSVGTLVWHKTNPVPFNHRYKPINAWEALVVGKRPGTVFNGHVVHNVFRCKSPSPQQRIHPTQKPVPLLEEFVRLFSDERAFVFDPFAGSASTLVAAHNRGRKSLGYENDPAIYSAAYDRLVREAGH